MDENKKIKDLNDILDEIIDKSKSFEQQIKSLKKLADLKWHCSCDDFGDEKLKSKYFKIKQTLGHSLESLANELINTINKEENQIIINNINKNEEKLCEECETSYGRDWMIQPNSQRIDLIDAIKLILNFHEKIQFDLVWK